MSKQISPEELAKIVTKLLTDPAGAGEIDSHEAFSSFMTAIAEVICDHCGGEVHMPADSFEDVWYVGIHGNDSLPDAFGGIWREYDKDGELFDRSQCAECGELVSSIIGTPSGAEICSDCFNAGLDATPTQQSQEDSGATPQEFVAQVASLRIWDYDSDQKTAEEVAGVDADGDEMRTPDEGFLDSHCCLMGLIEQARQMLAAAS